MWTKWTVVQALLFYDIVADTTISMKIMEIARMRAESCVELNRYDVLTAHFVFETEPQTFVQYSFTTLTEYAEEFVERYPFNIIADNVDAVGKFCSSLTGCDWNAEDLSCEPGQPTS